MELPPTAGPCAATLAFYTRSGVLANGAGREGPPLVRHFRHVHYQMDTRRVAVVVHLRGVQPGLISALSASYGVRV